MSDFKCSEQFKKDLEDNFICEEYRMIDLSQPSVERSPSKRLQRNLRISRNLTMAAHSNVPISCIFNSKVLTDPIQDSPSLVKKEINKLKYEKAELAFKLVETESNLLSMEDDITIVNDKNRKLSTDIESLKASLANYKKQAEENDVKADVIENLKIQYAQLNKDFNKQKQIIATLEDQLHKLSLDNDLANEEISKQTKKINEMSTHIVFLENELVLLKSENKELEKYKETHQKTEVEKCELLKRIDELAIANKNLEMQCADFNIEDLNEMSPGLRKELFGSQLSLENDALLSIKSEIFNAESHTRPTESLELEKINKTRIQVDSDDLTNLNLCCTRVLNETMDNLVACDMELCSPPKESVSISSKVQEVETSSIKKGTNNENGNLVIQALHVFNMPLNDQLDHYCGRRLFDSDVFEDTENFSPKFSGSGQSESSKESDSGAGPMMRNVVMNRRKYESNQVEIYSKPSNTRNFESIDLISPFFYLFSYIIWAYLSRFSNNLIRFITLTAKVVLALLFILLCLFVGFLSSSHILQINLRDYSHLGFRVSYPNGPPPI